MVRPASSDSRMPVSRNSRMIAVSRRSTSVVPLADVQQVAGVGGRQHVDRLLGTTGACIASMGSVQILLEHRPLEQLL